MTPIGARIAVTGDLIREAHIYQGTRQFISNDAATGFQTVSRLGGAALLHELLEAVRPGISTLGLEVDPSSAWPAHLEAQAIFAPFAAGFKNDSPGAGKKTDAVWRVAQALGYGAGGDIPPKEPPVRRVDKALTTANVLLVDDGGAGFRTLRAKDRWPRGGRTDKALPPWVVMKMSQPLCEGDLWRHVASQCSNGRKHASQLVVVVSADAVRRDGAAINKGLSWERTVSDTRQTLLHNPRFAPLRQAAHVLVVFRREGVLWVRRAPSTSPANAQYEATLVFDPGMSEGQWQDTLNDPRGEVFGDLSVFTAAVALELADLAPGVALDVDGFEASIKRGLASVRELRLLGHGPVRRNLKPAFPHKELAETLRPWTASSPGSEEPRGHFVAVRLPWSETRGHGGSLSPDWTLASLTDGGAKPRPLYGHGFQTAIYGPSRLREIPHARFGSLVSVDRDEIETLRSLRQMIQAYEQGGPQKQPLCIGAFGPPGAGKSFGIKQIAMEILGKDVPLLEFNLSQFDDPRDLIGAFHQVRDKVLTGRTPVVFWDEFDAAHFKWLQYLLAPMQDGKFQAGQLTHTLGKCVFVFAGATSWDFEHFGPAPEPASNAEAAELEKLLKGGTFASVRRAAQGDFRLKKGPDFVSRLSGHINVHGPNRRLKFSFATGDWSQPDPSDITFPVRRALLLRNFLKAGDGEALDIDRDLLNALIRQPRYRHGARSMEKTVEPLRGQHGSLSPAQLPSPQVLAQHLDPVAAFQCLLTETSAFLTDENLRKLAAAIHENYRRLFPKAGDVPDPKFRKSFVALAPSAQAPNLAAARGIPQVLAVAGLCVVPGGPSKAELIRAGRHLSDFIDALSCEEHKRWMNDAMANGWLQAVEKDTKGYPLRDSKRLLHKCLVPFDKLPPHEKNKDHAAILTLPETVAMVGFKIVPFPDLAA